jgi:hypothetical protein
MMMEKNKISIKINLIEWYLIPYTWEIDLRYEEIGYYKKTYNFLCFEITTIK